MPREVNIVNNLPPILRNYEEYKVISDAISPEINLLLKAISDAKKDQWIDSSTESGVNRREEMLNIYPGADDTLENRKFRLLIREIDKLPYTRMVLDRKLKALCGNDGYSLDINYNDFTVKVKVDIKSKLVYEEVKLLLDRIIPENMIINLSLLYNTHSLLSRYTHKQLSSYTHKQLREEVL